jgi:hypothetical protein
MLFHRIAWARVGVAVICATFWLSTCAVIRGA